MSNEPDFRKASNPIEPDISPKLCLFLERKVYVKIEIFSDIDVGSNESTWTVVIVFIDGRHFDSNELIDTKYLKYFPKIPCESIEFIDTVDLVLEVGSNET